jgi:hypothetical protein
MCIPAGSCICIQLGSIRLDLINLPRILTSSWLFLIISARSSRFENTMSVTPRNYEG